VRVDNQRLRPFIELRAFLWGSVNDNWNVQLNPLAAPLPQPLFCVIELLVAHKTWIAPCILHSVSGVEKLWETWRRRCGEDWWEFASQTTVKLEVASNQAPVREPSGDRWLGGEWTYCAVAGL
jgi:hypothetical protein